MGQSYGPIEPQNDRKSMKGKPLQKIKAFLTKKKNKDKDNKV